jgi:4-alpha-glucanotransferase
MSEWTLPPRSQRIFSAFVKETEHRSDWDAVRPFLKGGFWRSFLSRYDEANLLHKKMLRTSRKYHTLSVRKRRGDLYAPLLRGQCNCPYWHGVFGGLYLPHLRHATWKELLLSEYAMDNASHRGRKWVDIEKTDFDSDGQSEILMENAFANAYLAPGRGGMLFEWDYRPRGYNLLNTLTRHEEAYHTRLRQAVPAGDGERRTRTAEGTVEEGTASIHDLVLTKETGLERVLTCDRWPRMALLDHFPGWNSTLEEFQAGKMADYGSFLREPYELTELFTDAVALTRQGQVGGTPVELIKTVRLVPGRAALQIRYHLRNLARHELHTPFGIEWNLALQAAHSERHTLSLPELEILRQPLGESGDQDGIRLVTLVDENERVGARFQFEEPMRLWRAPIESVSLSEGGFERVFQSVALLFRWDLHLLPGTEWSMSFTATLGDA